MSDESVRQFVDANVYAYDAAAGKKKATAERLLAGPWETGAGCLGVQVLQDFFVTVTKKVANHQRSMKPPIACRDVSTWNVFAPNAEDVLRAIALHKEAKLSFWDAMVVHAAAELGCDVLWTEDLSDGQVLRGVRIRNPFKVDDAGLRDAEAGPHDGTPTRTP